MPCSSHRRRTAPAASQARSPQCRARRRRLTRLSVTCHNAVSMRPVLPQTDPHTTSADRQHEPRKRRGRGRRLRRGARLVGLRETRLRSPGAVQRVQSGCWVLDAGRGPDSQLHFAFQGFKLAKSLHEQGTWAGKSQRVDPGTNLHMIACLTSRLHFTSRRYRD